MAYALKLIYFIGCFSILIFFSESSKVATTTGPIEGIEFINAIGKKVKAFMGIPYAEPPVGGNRFKPPIPIKPWSETFLAQSRSKSCIQTIPSVSNMQKMGYEWFRAEDEDTSEDCLTLNIWVPDSNTKNKAVMIWIHGGAFEAGASALSLYDGQLLCSEGDVIVVSMNYRLNVFGFLFLDPEEAPGNMGLMDQALALKWVQDNIKTFGGDPKKVTIFGESAGGSSATHHLTIPSSKDLFQRVIAESGTSNAIWGYNDKFHGAKIGELIAHNSGCSKNAKARKDIIDCLRKIDANTLTELAVAAKNPSVKFLNFIPVIDGTYIPNTPEDAIKNIDQNVDVMLGAATHEGTFMLVFMNLSDSTSDPTITRQTFKAVVQFLVKSNEILASVVEHVYTDWENPDDVRKIREQTINVLSDYTMLCKINEFSDMLARHGSNVYRYQFAHQPSTARCLWCGSTHGDELPYIFGWPLIQERGFNADEVKLTKEVMSYWTNFAKHGNPNAESVENLPEWPKYSIDSRSHLSIEVGPKTATATNLRIQECALWEKLLPKIISATDLFKEKCDIKDSIDNS